jgi:hypothetical protein
MEVNDDRVPHVGGVLAVARARVALRAHVEPVRARYADRAVGRHEQPAPAVVRRENWICYQGSLDDAPCGAYLFLRHRWYS